MSNVDENYWKKYDGLQDAKHKLLRSYLGGWFPILASWQGRVLYIDCHAGRGRHETGHVGSPVLALDLLLGHSHRRRILANTDVHFHFFEIDEHNYLHLLDELEKLEPLPDGLEVEALHTDYESHLKEALNDLRDRGLQLAPSFAFLDPYGFSLSMDFLNEILSFPATELLINFMYRYVDMAVTHEEQDENMDRLFGGTNWKELRNIDEPIDRSETAIRIFGQQLSAEHVTHMYMRARNGALKYALIHATNHPRGRELIKDAMWNVDPGGTFSANEKDSPDQPVLLVPEPDLAPLEAKLFRRFRGKQVLMEELYEWLIHEIYLEKHLHQVIRDLRNEGKVTASDYGDRFAFNRNPIIQFPDDDQHP